MATKRAVLLMLVICVSALTFFLQASAQEKRLGRHTISEWRTLVDSLWGAGPPTSTKLQIFDTFWNVIDREYAGFPNLNLNWDSLKALYRPEIEAGVSRGRLSAITGQLFLSLQEIHTWIVDSGIDNAGYFSQHNVYVPGTPLFWTSGWGPCGVFGAALTPLPDSSVIVYRLVEPHPLGLVPGDIILGYEGIPWKRLYREVASAGFPPAVWGEGRWGSSPRSMTHSLLGSAGNNWGLFDTVDVVKYATGDTLHMPTAPLAGLEWWSLVGTEQLPVAGVKMPDITKGEFLTYGVLENTTVGYIYAYRWNAAEAPLFAAAVKDLVSVERVSGLILDFRYNLGSADSDNAADAGLDYLFNENPGGQARWRNAMRVSTNHLSFTYSVPFDQYVSMKPDFYDRPIAVLTGPQPWSFGDLNPFKVRSHPMARFFGLPTNGAFVVPGSQPVFGPLWGSWYYGRAGGQMQSLVNNEGFLMHKGFPVDEEVWLTRDGVAKGEDDVVKRAIEWITTLTYAHDVAASKTYVTPVLDSVCVTARLTNPLNHSAAVSSLVIDGTGVTRDSIRMFNDGLHGDGQAGDSVWGCYVAGLATEDIYTVGVRADDIALGTFRKLPNVTGFTTAGPLTIDSLGCTFLLSRYIQIKPYIMNRGSVATIRGAKIVFTSNDSWVITHATMALTLADITPGGVATSAAGGPTTILYDSTTCPGYVNLVAEMSVGGRTYWTDTTRVYLPGVGVEEKEALPTTFVLEQNYPNPFNPRTVVSSQLPVASDVKIIVYDVLGREVAVLVNERRVAGYYQDTFDATGLASGVYLYRLTGGSFVQTRKMIVVR